MKTKHRSPEAPDTFISVDPEVMGGTPVIKGTRLTVYSLLGRVEHGETVEDILSDYPDLRLEAVEAAIIYARTHPLTEALDGRPWAHER
jgi:uncharacterized protein (DUF433 family)